MIRGYGEVRDIWIDDDKESWIRRNRPGEHSQNETGIVKPYWPHIARHCETFAAIPHIARDLFREVSAPSIWCDPPRYLVLLRNICAIPHLQHIARELCDTLQNKHERVCVLSPQVFRHMESIVAEP